MLLTPFVLDAGNAQIKSSSPKGAVKEDCFPHIITKMQEGDWRRVMARAGVPDEDYFRVNGIPYAIGKKAHRHGQFERQFGASRYNQEYYGVFLAVAMARVFRRSRKNVFLMGSHPPGDVDYRDDLMAAACRHWQVEWRGETFEFDVIDANTFDEPLGGWANVILRKDGRGYANSKVNNGVTLVIDIGAYTTDGLVIDPGGQIDYSTGDSAKVGVLKAVEQFKKDFRSANRLLTKDVPDFDEEKVHDAIRTGMFDLRGLGKHDCAAEANEICNDLVSRVVNFYDGYGGAANYDYIILTGGGSALLETRLRQAINHNNIILGDTDISSLHMANVRGGLKWYRMHEELGTFS